MDPYAQVYSSPKVAAIASGKIFGSVNITSQGKIPISATKLLNMSIASDEITVPNAGLYLFTFNFIKNLDTATLEVMIGKNGTPTTASNIGLARKAPANFQGDDMSTPDFLSFSNAVELAANDVVQFYLNTGTIFHDSNQLNYFSISKLD